MFQFMISGYIPGTTRQVGFYELLIVFSIICGLYLIRLLFKERRALQQLVINDIFNNTI